MSMVTVWLDDHGGEQTPYLVDGRRSVRRGKRDRGRRDHLHHSAFASIWVDSWRAVSLRLTRGPSVPEDGAHHLVEVLGRRANELAGVRGRRKCGDVAANAEVLAIALDQDRPDRFVDTVRAVASWSASGRSMALPFASRFSTILSTLSARSTRTRSSLSTRVARVPARLSAVVP